MTIAQPQLNEYAIYIEDGDWELAITKMVHRGHTPAEVHEFCRAINFYPSEKFTSLLHAEYNRQQLSKLFN